MDTKKIFAIIIVALALFSCMNVASAGMFDFFNDLGGGEQNETFTINGFTLDFPKGTTISDSNYTDDGVTTEQYIINVPNSTDFVTVEIFYGPNSVDTVDEYVSNWESDNSGHSMGKYNGWTIIKEDTNSVRKYELVLQDGNRFISIGGDNLAYLKNVADTYKKL